MLTLVKIYNIIKLCMFYFIAAIVFNSCGEPIRVVRGHSHNDYLQERPLIDAINNGMISIEVDLHLVNDKLYVSHDAPTELNDNYEFENMYMKQLREIVDKNNGRVYPGCGNHLMLMLDIKTDSTKTYNKIIEILNKYTAILSIVENGIEDHGAVKVYISGNRPISQILNSEPIIASLDGRPDDLKYDYPSNIMPVISQDFRKIMSWDGTGNPKESEVIELKKLIAETHSQGKRIRLWGAPDNEAAWRFLLDSGIDLVNTDKPEELYHFIRHNKN